MSRDLLGAPNWVWADQTYATVALSGGAWRPANPLSNLLNQRLGSVARSMDLDPASTCWWLDLGRLREVRAVALGCSASLDGRIRITWHGSPDTDSLVIATTGWCDLWPVIYPGAALTWESAHFWTRRASDEDRARVTYPLWWYVHARSHTARYALIEIADQGNPAGSVDVTDVWACPGFLGERLEYGATLTATDPSLVRETLSGRQTFAARHNVRDWQWRWSRLEHDRALAVLDIGRSHGVTEPVLAIFDYADTLHAARRAFRARMSAVALQHVRWDRADVRVQLREMMG